MGFLKQLFETSRYLNSFLYANAWVFPKIGVPQDGWFIMVQNPINIDDLGGKTVKPPLCLVQHPHHVDVLISKISDVNGGSRGLRLLSFDVFGGAWKPQIG